MKTGHILRHASAEFYLEGKSLSGQPRSTWSLMLKPYCNEYVLGLACSTAVVSGVDNIPSDWPEEVAELVHEMAKIRDDCALSIKPLASQDPNHIKYIEVSSTISKKRHLADFYGVSVVGATRRSQNGTISPKPAALAFIPRTCLTAVSSTAFLP
jgi:hypothetical protein